jgi:hypothetical protein
MIQGQAKNDSGSLNKACHLRAGPRLQNVPGQKARNPRKPREEQSRRPFSKPCPAGLRTVQGHTHRGTRNERSFTVSIRTHSITSVITVITIMTLPTGANLLGL